MLRQAFRAFGVNDVACVELDANTRKLIFAVEGDGRTYEFEDVPQGYEDDTKRVIPNSFRYIIVWTLLQPTELTLRQPSALGGTGSYLTYSRMPTINVLIQQFLNGLGYQALNGVSGNLSPANAFGALSGISEHGRMGNPAISPEYGSMLRGVNRIITDLPVVPTKPIDAGIYEFCRTCKICAKNCPFDAISMDDATWETHDFEVDGMVYSPPGYKGWRTNMGRCTLCAACQAACPFNSTKHTFIHYLAGSTIANIPLLNGFNARMGEFFRYGPKEPESWWDLPDQPVYGVDPHLLRPTKI